MNIPVVYIDPNLNENIVVVISGGLDSTTLLNLLVKREKIDPSRISPITFNYGQIAKKESDFAKLNCDNLKTKPIQTINVSQLQELFESSLLDTEYNTVSRNRPSQISVTKHDDIVKTVVPLRNGIMLSVAAVYASKHRKASLFYGAHKSDYYYFPDCRQSFVNAFNNYLYNGFGYDYEIKLHAPFTELLKSDIVKLGTSLGVDYTKTWSCYEDTANHCGKCHSCSERKKAFVTAGVDDPTTYET